nr:twin-arginine translocation signal domain-containing protein [Burkholderia sp. Leaf177]
MSMIDRRHFLKTSAVGALASATASTTVFAQSPDASSAASAAAAAEGHAHPRGIYR